MFNKKGLMLLGVALMGLAACTPASNPEDDFFEQNSNSFDVPVLKLSIVGSNWANWNPADAAKDEKLCFTMVDSSLYELKGVEVKPGDMFKFVQDGAWAVQYGMEDLNWEKSNVGELFGDKKMGDWHEGATNRSNVEPKVAGTLDIQFMPYEFSTPAEGLTAKFVFNFTPAA